MNAASFRFLTQPLYVVSPKYWPRLFCLLCTTIKSIYYLIGDWPFSTPPAPELPGRLSSTRSALFGYLSREWRARDSRPYRQSSCLLSSMCFYLPYNAMHQAFRHGRPVLSGFEVASACICWPLRVLLFQPEIKRTFWDKYINTD